jgi:hypothetical protein
MACSWSTVTASQFKFQPHEIMSVFTPSPAVRELFQKGDLESIKDYIRDDYEIFGKHEKDIPVTTLDTSYNVAVGPIYGGRFDVNCNFIWGGTAGSHGQAIFVPFFVAKEKQFTKCAIHVRTGATETYALYGGMYAPDANGYPKTLVGSSWSWDVSATGKRESVIAVPPVKGLFYIALLPQIGATSWSAAAGAVLSVLGTSQSLAGIAPVRMLFNLVPQNFALYDGPMGCVSSLTLASLPPDLSSPEVRRLGQVGAGNMAHCCILY